ncbi:MAG TPA: protein phosphatase 2C domain-containing protein [Polyangiaceae bacterium]|jgi:protein phosphatase
MDPVPALPAIEYAARTDPGRDPDKQVNEDAHGYRETRFGHLCVVCDGMGGHAAGREAAELAVATIFETFETAPGATSPGQVLKTAVEEASRRVHVMQTSEIALGRPGSTAVAVLMHAGGTEVAHVGDSRVYLVHEAQIFRVTRDHSIVQELVDRGLLTLEQATHHPDANRITRALGMAPDVDAELRPQPVHHVVGDAFILCSDGLSDLVEDGEILSIVAAQPAAQAAGKLVDLANARGGHDNITVVVLRARETALTSGASLAPTLAQIPETQPPATQPAGTSGPTLVESYGAGAVERTTQPGVPAPAVIPTAPDPPPLPPRSSGVPRRRSRVPLAVIVVVLALLAIALLGAVLLAHIQERNGKRNTTTTLPMSTGETPAASAFPLVPGSVVVPPVAPPREPIVPLEPSPAPSKRR